MTNQAAQAVAWRERKCHRSVAYQPVEKLCWVSAKYALNCHASGELSNIVSPQYGFRLLRIFFLQQAVELAPIKY